jgi:hypothetical protein
MCQKDAVRSFEHSLTMRRGMHHACATLISSTVKIILMMTVQGGRPTAADTHLLFHKGAHRQGERITVIFLLGYKSRMC